MISAPAHLLRLRVGGGRGIHVTHCVETEHRRFQYSRASPEVRWPGTARRMRRGMIEEEEEEEEEDRRELPVVKAAQKSQVPARLSMRNEGGDAGEGRAVPATALPVVVQNGERESRSREVPLRTSVRRLSNLALKKAKDWKFRVDRLASAVCDLEVERPVADVLEGWPERLAPNDLCSVLTSVGQTNWQRALELYEWLNLRFWYTPNPRMLASILGILGRSGQVTLAAELFRRAEPELQTCVQVYNALLGVYARHGQWQEVQDVLMRMQRKGCEPDIITFNTIANTRCKGELQPGMASSLLQEIQRAGLRPDAITYNTLISGCLANQSFTEARAIIAEMKRCGFGPDAYTQYAISSARKHPDWDQIAKEVLEGSE